MGLTFNQVKAITDTLPIGFYANRRITAELGKDETSWYNPTDDTILISYDQLMQGINKFNGDIETFVRSNFYHEVSHAILTPKIAKVTDIYNIFEDERIETLLKDFYYNVDFEQQVYAINGLTKGNLPPITSLMDAFYSLVRFRACPFPQLLPRVDKIINKFATLNRNSDPWYNREYTREIERLYDDLRQLIKQYQSQHKGQPMQFTSGDLHQSQKTTPNPSQQGQPQNCNTTNETQGDNAHNQVESTGDTNEFIKELVSQSINAEFNYNFHKSLEIIFDQFRKKNSKGNSLNAYSGILNPRAIVRNDYKYFERSQNMQGNNQFGTFHLNLFIDISGSFEENEQVTNQIIKSLILIERKNPNFTFDVITTNTETVLRPKDKRFISCCGGTYLGKQIEQVYRQVQLSNTYNYNIVLFDGDAYCSSPEHRNCGYTTDGQGFATFSANNTTIISDKENKMYIQQFAPTVRTIYTKHYTEELLNNILLVMAKALN